MAAPVLGLTALGVFSLFLAAGFGPTILKQYGVNLTPEDVNRGIDKNPVVYVQTPPATPGAVLAPPQQPSVKEITKDAVNNPVSLFGIAAVGFVGVFVISQLRAGFHEGVATTKDLYGEGQRVSKSLANADGSTRNISRRARG